jgi:hypothetical protein
MFTKRKGLGRDGPHYIRHEDMKAWLLSWGTDHELPPA